MEARIDINRRYEQELELHKMEFVIKLAVGREITVTMSAEDFVLAMTGRSEVIGNVKTRNVTINTEAPKAIRAAGLRVKEK